VDQTESAIFSIALRGVPALRAIRFWCESHRSRVALLVAGSKCASRRAWQRVARCHWPCGRLTWGRWLSAAIHPGRVHTRVVRRASAGI